MQNGWHARRLHAIEHGNNLKMLAATIRGQRRIGGTKAKVVPI